MNYLVWRASGADGAHGSLSTRILQSGPILEGLEQRRERRAADVRVRRHRAQRHLLVSRSTVPSKKGKKAKKKEEWTLEYFILLHSKHLVHFQPNTGFVDPFKKTISGKAIDLMQASVAMDDEPTEGSSELQAFRIKTSRIEYHLKPQDEVGGNAEDWVEEITEVMLAAEEGDDDDADRDYGAFMGDYNGGARERGNEAAAVRERRRGLGQVGADAFTIKLCISREGRERGIERHVHQQILAALLEAAELGELLGVQSRSSPSSAALSRLRSTPFASSRTICIFS